MLSLGSAKNPLFFMTGRRNRAHAPKQTLACGSLPASCRHDALQAKKRDIFPAGKVWFLPPRPSPPFGFLYGSKKLDTEDFKLQRTATRFSANIIGCCSICLREVRATGRRRRLPLLPWLGRLQNNQKYKHSAQKRNNPQKIKTIKNNKTDNK